MKVEFTVTADLETGILTIECPEAFKLTNNGWGPEIQSDYPAKYQEKVVTLLGPAVRARFMNVAKLTTAEVQI